VTLVTLHSCDYIVEVAEKLKERLKLMEASFENTNRDGKR